jgi:hypothetical protein
MLALSIFEQLAPLASTTNMHMKLRSEILSP